MHMYKYVHVNKTLCLWMCLISITIFVSFPMMLQNQRLKIFGRKLFLHCTVNMHVVINEALYMCMYTI